MRYKVRLIMYILAAVIIFFISSLVFIEFRMKLIRNEISEFTARNTAASAILNGVEEALKQSSVYYSDVIEIHHDESGNVKSIETDTAKLNTVSNTVNRNVDKRISELKSIPVKIPVTTFFGDEIFSGIGPKLTFYVTITGSASTKFRNAFDSTGVNQTRHQIMLDVSADIYVIFGKKIENYTVKSNVCVAESIIIGEIPQALAQRTD